MDLTSKSGLLAAADQALAARRDDPTLSRWTEHLRKHLDQVRSASESEFRSEAFQQSLWEDEAISATGMGRVPTGPLRSDPELIDLLWMVKNIQTDDRNRATSELANAWDTAVARIKLLSKRVPRLKLARAFASLQPRYFTTVADQTSLIDLAKELGVYRPNAHRIELNRRVLDRIDEILAEVHAPPTEPTDLLRLKLPWVIYEQWLKGQQETATVAASSLPGALSLVPLPPEKRTKGLSAMKGWLQSILDMIECVKDSPTRDELKEFIHAKNPQLSPGSVGFYIQTLIREWGAATPQGGRLVLTSRGAALAEAQDPDVMSDWLLTRILGFDHALVFLAEAPKQKKTLISEIKSVNPGWTSTFAPTAMISWLKALGLTQQTRGGFVELTAEGRDWASRINWTPEKLAPTTVTDNLQNEGVDIVTYVRPKVEQIAATFPPDLAVDRKLIAKLDAGLWAHERRHFVVLSGLSGAGKTQLAMNYAAALWSKEGADPSDGICLLPVEPGWHDPTSLLGYASPIHQDQYVPTRFLNFLLDASRDPQRPYTLILDEMNLSHPEQYLAPLLSAMETGNRIELHTQNDDIDEIPGSVPYPSNLLIIGTVNMDETTHGLSDKVLDRASVVEFWDIDTDSFPGWTSSSLDVPQANRVKDLLRELNGALSPARLHFGWRTIGDVLGYIRASIEGGEISFEEAIDHAVYAKVLPKLRGEDSPLLQKALNDCRRVLASHSLKESAAKVSQLTDELARIGTARFWR
jgi:5-methylcytosine-specific restriction enzyme B